MDYQGAHDIRSYERDVGIFLQRATNILRGHGFTVDAIVPTFIRTPNGVEPWVSLQFPSPCVAQAFYYVFHDHQSENDVGTQVMHIQLWNQTFQTSLRVREVSLQLVNVWQRRRFEGFNPRELQRLHDMDGVTYANSLTDVDMGNAADQAAEGQ